MGVIMTGQYLGEKKVALVHTDSGITIQTAAPVDNNGDGSSFSPTDLFSSSLGACMLTIMGMVAERDGVSLVGSTFKVEKTMSASPRRVATLDLEFHLPKNITQDQQKKYEQAAKTCPVHHSLHPDIVVNTTYLYDR